MGNERIQAPQKDGHESADADKGSPQATLPSPSNDRPLTQEISSLTASSADDVPLTHENVLYLQRTIGNRAVVQLLQRKGKLSQPGDAYEQEADRVAGQVMTEPNHAAIQAAQPNMVTEAVRNKTLTAVTPLLQRDAASAAQQSEQGAEQAATGDSFDADNYLETRLNAAGGGNSLPDEVRAFMEPQFGADFSQVRVHTDSDAAQMSQDLDAQAFTTGHDIYYGEGKTPGNDATTAHELTHVIQQTGGARTQQISGPITDRVGTKRIQRSLTSSASVPLGGFEADLQTRLGALNPSPTKSGLDGYIRFIPNESAPNSNSIVIIQIVKLTDQGGGDVNASSMPAPQAPRGALGQPGVRTQDDAARGVEGGYATDVYHRRGATGPVAPQGSSLSPRYDFQPAAPGTVGIAGQTQQPAQYGGGTGGVTGQTPGFKRSSDPSDIRSAVMYDFPGTSSATANLDFSFETVVRGEDTMITYGAVMWGFGLRNGQVVNERINFVDTHSATFNEAMERHRDFYVYEPVTFYFPFNSDVLSAAEAAKIDAFLPYLTRNPDVKVSLEGFADIRGGASRHNRELSSRRDEAVAQALLAKGVAANRITRTTGSGASTTATTDAGTGDQPGGSAAVGADQDREANRQFNRRVVLTFEHVPVSPAPGPAPAPGP